MKTITIDLIQIIAGSGLLYGYYHFALRNKKFHGYNRFYLLMAVTISLFIPFLHIPLYFTQAEQNDSLVYQAMTVFTMEDSGPVIISHIKPASHFFTTENIFRISYILVAVLLITRFIISLNSIRLLYKKYPSQKLENLQFIDTTDPSTPFSFFRLLFWNRQIELKSGKGQQIFRHEWFHISQKHSLDIIYMELLTIVCWFNPFFHLAKKELKAIHEFLADEYAVKNSESWEYAELLLIQALQTQQTRLVNPFFHNHIKRRIAMITLSKKPRYQYLRKIMVLPLSVLLIVLFAFTVKTKETQNVQVSPNVEKIANDPANLKSSALSINDTLKQDKVLYVIDGKIQAGKSLSEIKIDPGSIKEMNVLKGKDAMDKYGNAGRNGVIEIISRKKPETGDNTPITVDTIPAENNSVFLKTEISASFPGGESAWQNFLRNNLNSNVPVTKGAPAGSYTVWVQFIVHTDGSITDLKSLTNHSFGMEEEVMRVMKHSPNWLPAIQNGKRVTAYVKQQVTFVVEKQKDNSTLKPSQQKTVDSISLIPTISLEILRKASPLELLQLPDAAKNY